MLKAGRADKLSTTDKLPEHGYVSLGDHECHVKAHQSHTGTRMHAPMHEVSKGTGDTHKGEQKCTGSLLVYF